MNKFWRLVVVSTGSDVTMDTLKSLGCKVSPTTPCEEYPYGMIKHQHNLAGLESWKFSIPQVLGLEFRPAMDIVDILEYTIQCEELRCKGKCKRTVPYKTLQQDMECTRALIDSINVQLGILRSRHPKLVRD